MKGSELFIIITFGLLMTGGCRSGTPGGPTGLPNPPFAGEPPTEAYIFKGQHGTYGGKMVLTVAGEIQTYNPIAITDANSAQIVWGLVSRSLVDFGNADVPPSFIEGLASRWEMTPDATEWTFYLRKGVRWSDGEPFTADDVLFTYNAVLDDKVDTSIRSALYERIGGLQNPLYPEIEKLDDYTLRFKLHKPNWRFLDSISSLWLLPKHKMEEKWITGKLSQALGPAEPPDQILSLGPFCVKEYIPGQRVVLERNPYFWKVDTNGQRLPYLDQIVFVVVNNPRTIPLKLQAGEIDGMIRVRSEDYSAVSGMSDPSIVLNELGPSFDPAWITFNQNSGSNPLSGKPLVEPWKLNLFRDQRFRQAISYAINREALGNTVYADRAVPIFSFVTPADKYWYSDNVVRYPYDPDRAKQMLAEIGLKDTNRDGFLETAERHTVEITITTNTSPQRENTVTFIRSELTKVGIKVRPNLVPFLLLVQAMDNSFDFDAVVSSWQIGVPPGPVTARNILLSSAPQHVWFPLQSSPSTEWEAQVDRLVEEIGASQDREKQKALYSEVQRIWSEQLPVIPLVAQREAVAYIDKFGNLRPSALQPRLTWNAEEIFLKRK